MREKANLFKWLFIVSLSQILLCPTAKGEILLNEAEAKYGGGTGEPNNPYLIYTAEQLNTIGTEPNDWDKHFMLMSDIDLSNYTGTSFNIIGTSWSRPFTGMFDGNGHTISNFNRTGGAGGIFPRVEEGTIKNLVLVDINVSSMKQASYVAALVDYLVNATVSNCTVEGGSVSGGSTVGGLIGRSYYGTINKCNINCIISGTIRVGGLVGEHFGTITDCHFNGEVSGSKREVGGLVGNNSGTISSCSASSYVSGSTQVGGLVGKQWGRIDDCFSSGSVSGQEDVGGLIGRNNGFITNSYTTSDVSGVTYIGGFAGQNGRNSGDVIFGGYIHNCYAEGSVVGEENIGGLVGYNDYWGEICYCYTTSEVSGTVGVGGLVGSNNRGDIIDSFWDIETSDQKISDGGVGKTTVEMQTVSNFIQWGACGNQGVWTLDEGNDYPRLWWENQPGEAIVFTEFSGTGSKDEPFLIYTAEQLNLIGLFPCYWDRHFRLMADIDMSAYTGTEYNIPGYYMDYYDKKPFAGVFDGNNHTISNFSYISADANNVGLFGFVSDPNAEIKNLRLASPFVSVQGGEHIGSLVGLLLGGSVNNCYVNDCTVSGSFSIGGLIGQNSNFVRRGPNPDYVGIITNCYSTGSVTGVVDVGGLIGANYLGDIVYCFSTSSVTGTSFLGGLVGANVSSIADCYSVGSVTGGDNIGGLVGINYRKIVNCYSTGIISGTINVGGFIGYNDVHASVYSSFWDIYTSDQTESMGGERKTTVEMQSESTFTDAGWDFAGETANGTEDIWWILEGQDYPRLWWEVAEE